MLLLPAVRIVPPETWSLLDRELLRLEEFDWVLFTSRNAVRFVAERLENSVARFAATGAVAARGRRRPGDCGGDPQEGLERGLRGARVKPEIRSRTSCRESLAGRRVLLPRSDRADDVLPIALEKNGAKVREVVAYLNLRAPIVRSRHHRSLAPRRNRLDRFRESFGISQSVAHAMGAKELTGALRARSFLGHRPHHSEGPA